MIDWKDCIVPVERHYTRRDLYMWVAYDKNYPYLPVAIGRTAEDIGKMLGIQTTTVESTWHKYRKGILKRSRFHRVKVGLDPI